MIRRWGHAIAALIAIAAALLWPLTAALPFRDALQARLASGVVAALACALFASQRSLRGRIAIPISVVAAAIGVALLIQHLDALTVCIADYDGRPLIIGSAYTPLGESYLRDKPGEPLSDLLLDIGGEPSLLWTAESIRACRLLVSWAGLAAIPLFAVSAAALIPGRRYTLSARSTPTAPLVTTSLTPPVYDGFISYRHLEPDRTIALELVETLESRGLRMAIDARDFSPNEHFLAEMERCIKASRFVLCVITSQYVLSEHTSEEAIISKTLDLAERRRRLVPLLYERVELPVWLHGLVGIDFTPGASVDPHERLAQLLTHASANQKA
jgi:hypothetical protein